MKDPISYPKKLLEPIGKFLDQQIQRFERRKGEVASEDPFEDTRRLSDNASPDSDAAEQFGHARVAAIKAEIDHRIIQTKKALSRLNIGKYGVCESCGGMIDTDRLMVYPETTFCIFCEKKREK